MNTQEPAPRAALALRAHGRPACRRGGLTIVDVLMIMAVAAALITISLSSIQNARQSVRHLESAERLRSVGTAYEMHWRQHGCAPSPRQWKLDIAAFLPGALEGGAVPAVAESRGDDRRPASWSTQVLSAGAKQPHWLCYGYAMNEAASQFNHYETGRVVLLEYDLDVARPQGLGAVAEWDAFAANLDLPLINVLYGDYSVRALAPELLDPTVERNVIQRWLPADSRQ